MEVGKRMRGGSVIDERNCVLLPNQPVTFSRLVCVCVCERVRVLVCCVQVCVLLFIYVFTHSYFVNHTFSPDGWRGMPVVSQERCSDQGKGCGVCVCVCIVASHLAKRIL